MERAEGKPTIARCRLILPALGEILARGPILIDDALGEQVQDLLFMSRLVGTEDVIEATIFADNVNDVLDRRFSEIAFRP